MMTPKQIEKALQDRNLSRVARSTDLSYDTVWRAANGELKQPSYETIRALSAYLTKNP